MKKFLLFALMSLPLSLSAQNHHEIGLVAGVSGYKGDLAQNWFPHPKAVFPTGGIQYKYFTNPHVGFRFGLNVLQIGGADSLSEVKSDVARNLSFSNRLVELQAGIELNLLPVDIYKFKFTPYAFAGIAAVHSNPYAYDREFKKVYLRDLSTEGQGLPNYPDRKPYSVFHASFPIGIGLKGFIGNTVMVTAEVGLRYVTSDYLDDVSRSYVNLDTLLQYKGAKSVEMSYRGDELKEWDQNYPADKYRRGDYQNNDWYWSATIGFAIYFEAFGNPIQWRGSKCPRIIGRD